MRRAWIVLVAAFAGLASGDDDPDTGRVRVRVVDTTGRPVESPYAGVVSARRIPSDGLWTRAEIGPAPRRRGVCVAVARSGPARVVAYAADPGVDGVAVSPWFDVKPGATTDAGVVRLLPAWRVHGDVVGADGELVRGARITIVPESGVDPELWALLRRAGHFPETRSFVHEGRGGFDYVGLPPGTYRFGVFRPHRRDAEPTLTARATVPPTGSGTIPLRFVLPQAATPGRVTVRVRAVDTDGAPISGFRGGVGNDLFGHSFEASGEEAIGEGFGVPPLHLEVWASGYRDALVDVVQREEPYVVRLERIDPRLRISGTITCGGKRVEWQRSRMGHGRYEGAAFRMTVTPEDGAPDDAERVVGSLNGDGCFEYTPPRAGRWRLRVSGEDAYQRDHEDVPLPAEVVVDAGSRGVEIEVRRGTPLVVEVVPPEGMIVDHYEACLIDETGATNARRRTVFTASGNSLTFPSLPPDHVYTLLVAARCGALWTDVGRVGHLRPSCTDPASVSLPRGRAVPVRVVRADRSPVVGANVRRADVPFDLDLVTGLDGTVRMTLPADDAAALTASALGLASGEDPVTVAAVAGDVTIVVAPTPYDSIP